MIPEKYFFAKFMKFRRNLFPSRPIFSLNSVNGQPPGSKSDFFGTLTSGDESGEKLHSAITGSGIFHKMHLRWMGKVLPRNRDGRLITASKWNFLEIEFPDEVHMCSKKPPFRIGIHLTFFIRAQGWSLGRSRDHAGCQGIPFSYGITGPNGLPKARDGGGGAHDFFPFRATSSPRRAPFSFA